MRYLSVGQTARLLGVSVRTLRRWRQTEGMGPAFVQFSARTVKYDAAAVERFRRDHAKQ